MGGQHSRRGLSQWHNEQQPTNSVYVSYVGHLTLCLSLKDQSTPDLNPVYKNAHEALLRLTKMSSTKVCPILLCCTTARRR